MNSDNIQVPPLPPQYRASGILLHITSLPGPYGIGDFGLPALSFIDRLDQAGQRWWQVLPLDPTGEGNSPYQSLSSFAGNELLISPDWLREDGLLKRTDCAHPFFPPAVVEFDKVIPYKRSLIKNAWTKFKRGACADLRPEFEKFRNAQSHWLDDYALFHALRDNFGGAHYLEWPEELIEREPAALDRMRRELADQIDLVCFAQFLVARQAERLKAYAHAKGMGLIGDIPFYAAGDSSDVWAHPELFLLDEQRRPRFVGGVPPDYFSENGQLWGNPVYDWEAHRNSGYRWWIDRLRSRLTHVDALRLDHFRAFSAAWYVPAEATTARIGNWIPGPGADFFQALAKELGSLPFIAEDLGLITPEVYTLRDQFHFPGMRILQFAFDGHSDNPHLPENYVTNSVVYTGTHDNPTTRGWFEELPADLRQSISTFLERQGAKSGEVPRAMIEVAWSSVAALAMAPLQDLLNLGKEARMNVPGCAEGNWRWRCTAEMLSDPAFEWLRDLTKTANRPMVSTTPNVKAMESGSGD